MKTMVVGAVLSAALLCAGANLVQVQARVPAEVLARAELSMLVKGRIDVEPDGRVSTIKVDDEAEYSEAVMRFVRDTVRGWEFEPIIQQGQAVAFTTPMSLRLVASQAGGGAFDIRIASQSFSEYDPQDRSIVRNDRMQPPRYPEAAYRAGITGTVYLALAVGRDGKVVEVAAKQVDLTSAGNERQMQQARQILADASLQAARRWTFLPPETGDDAVAQSWVVQVPVSFQLAGTAERLPSSRWLPYIPGPRLEVPFLQDEDEPVNTALADGGVYMSGRTGPRLKLPQDN